MRPGQNKQRMRGRPNNNRKGPNPLTRSYESSGPDVKIRGTAHHIGEKYLQLARDAQSSGDPVTAESYLQHAEHYFRLIAMAQQAQQQSAAGYQRQPGEAAAEEIDDGDDFTGIPDRFASPVERFAAPQPAYAPQPSGSQQPGQERGFYGAGGNGGPEKQGPDRSERGPRPERTFQDRSYQDRSYQDRSNPERYGQERYAPARDQGSRDQGPRDQGGRDQGPRDQGPRDQGGRDQGPRDQGPRDQGPRDQGGRDQGSRDQSRNGRGQRDFRGEPSRDQRVEARGPEDAAPKGLPAFITAPVRTASETIADSLEADAPVEAFGAIQEDRSEAEREPNGFHLRPRRRRRSKAEMAIDQAAAHDDSSDAETSAEDPVGD
jgi:hypothetical protein